jgi:hypothetical protein
MDDRFLANRGIFTDRDARTEGDSIPNLTSVSDINKGIDGEVLAQLSRGTDPGVGINSFGLIRMRGVEADHFSKSQMRISYTEERFLCPGNLRGDDNG